MVTTCLFPNVPSELKRVVVSQIFTSYDSNRQGQGFFVCVCTVCVSDGIVVSNTNSLVEQFVEFASACF